MSNIIKSSAKMTAYINDNQGEPQYKLNYKKGTEDDEFKKLLPELQNQVCNDILSQAKEQARKIVDQAQNYSLYYMKSTADRIKSEYEITTSNHRSQAVNQGLVEGEKKGYDIGFDAGYKDGLLKADEESKKTIKFLHSVIEGIDEGKQDILKKYEDDLKELAFEIAKGIVKKEIELHPETLQNIIESAAQSCKNQGYLRVIVSQSNQKLLTSDCCELANNLSGISDDVKIVSDCNMNDEDCIIETPIGVIDAGVNTQLNNIENVLKEQAQ